MSKASGEGDARGFSISGGTKKHASTRSGEAESGSEPDDEEVFFISGELSPEFLLRAGLAVKVRPRGPRIRR